MPNGKPHDHPVTDTVSHGLHPFPPDIEDLVQQLHARNRRVQWPPLGTPRMGEGQPSGGGEGASQGITWAPWTSWDVPATRPSLRGGNRDGRPECL